jgi:hypothetical protein
LTSQKKSEVIASTEIYQSFERSLSSIIGQSATQAFLANSKITQDNFDPAEVSRALSSVFGSSQAGLSLVQKKLVSELSKTLQLTDPETSMSGFEDSISKMVSDYRRKIAIKYSTSGIVAAFVSSLCCLGPFSLLLLGLASASAALSLEKTLYAEYHVILVLLGLGMVAGVVFIQLRRDNVCTLSGVRKNLGYILVPAAALLASYAVLNYLIGIFFMGGAMPSMLYP